jgi:hypothetical protein
MACQSTPIKHIKPKILLQSLKPEEGCSKASNLIYLVSMHVNIENVKNTISFLLEVIEEFRDLSIIE